MGTAEQSTDPSPPVHQRGVQEQQSDVAPHITFQAPLSRRGHGPGLIIVADHYAALDKSDTSLDPPPLVKWAEEGFAVALVLVPGRVGEFHECFDGS